MTIETRKKIMPVELTREIRDRRVAVAKDVLAQLEAHKINVARGGFYLRLETDLPDDVTDLQACVDEVGPSCKICLRGAMLLSKARLFNDVPLDRIRRMNGFLLDGLHANRIDTRDLLADTFDEETLDLLECAFEGAPEFARQSCGLTRSRAATAFGATVDYDPEERVRLCMNNLIDNDGEFIVPDTD
jgi:hypothetical protein